MATIRLESSVCPNQEGLSSLCLFGNVSRTPVMCWPMSQTLLVSANGVAQESDIRTELGMQRDDWGVTRVKGTGRKVDWA